MQPTEKQLAALLRLKTDFAFWCANAWKIIDKTGNHVPLILNAAQLHAYAAIKRQQDAGLPVRLIYLKGRQQGISTMLEAWITWRCTTARAKRGYVLAHQAESSQALFEMSKRGYEALPEKIKPKAKKSNIKELSWSELDSCLTVATAGGRGPGRGRTFQYAHLSEVAFWEAGFAETNFNGLLQTVPNVTDSAIFIESTAQGIGGLFHRLWTDAERGASEFDAVFIPWFWQPEYRLPVDGPLDRTPEEIHLVNEYGLDDGQLMWRRKRVAATGRDAFDQEYPSTPSVAFLTSGRPAFEPALVHKLLAKAPAPIKTMALEPTEDGKAEFVAHSHGELSVYHSPDPSQTYYIGADVAEGVRDGDYSVAQVLDGNYRQVAVWRGHLIPDQFAHVLAALGDLYNDAMVCVEVNNHGLLTANTLAKELQYPQVWTETTVDRVTDDETTRLGFTTNPKTRPLILNKLRAALRDETIEINDKLTLKEMLSFSFNAAGRMEAESNAHDDHVMSLAICYHIHEGMWEPIKNQDKYYYEGL